ncbi:MAG: alginate export family protein [Gemmatimonadetes bacterium]|nr:alginate export family protein [Gemmatimonadota bacterium]NIO31943.1 alginate export family protein [Gemmatimonadota bacterium]
MSRRSRRRRAAVVVLPALFLFSLAESSLAQESEFPAFRFDGQFRLRGEADGRTAGVDPDAATLSRIRGGVQVSLLDWIRVYAQLQDARAWGTEDNTLTDASAELFDLHQGYADLGKTDGFTARLGRQSMGLADERLVGAVEWTNTGRAFDGVRVFGEYKGVTWTAFWMNVAERDELLTVGVHPQLNQGINDDGWFIGGFATRKFGDVTSELTALFDRDAITEESYTLNLRVHGRTGSVVYEGAAAYQGGPGRSAYFASGKAGLAIGRGTVAAQLDYLSGDSDTADAETKAFNTLYATNHKFYGYMDYFLDIPGQLDEAGLVDALLRGTLTTSQSTNVRLDLHRFLTAQKRNGERALGTELDLVGRWQIEQPATLEAGVGIFVPEDLASDLLSAFADGKNTTWWGYLQLILNWP